MNFGELVARVRRWRGISSSAEESDSTTFIKQTINAVYREVISQDSYPWLVKETVIMGTPQFTDGYLMATNGLNIMTLHDTSTYTGLDYRYWGGRLVVSGEDMYYTVVKTALGAASTHTIYLDRPFVGTSTASVEFALYRDCYPLPSDFNKVEGPVRFAGDSDFELVPRQSSGLDKLHPQNVRDYIGGDPEEYSVWKRRDGAWFTASATVTNGGYSIELSGDYQYYGIESWEYRVVEDAAGERYRVVRQDNEATTDTNVVLAIDRPFAAASSTDTVVTIDPRGCWQIQFWPPPVEAVPIILKYISDDYDMVNNADTPVIPEQYHDALWKGAIYHIASFDRDIPAEERMLLKQDYMEARGRIESQSKVVDRNLRMRRRMYGTYLGPQDGLRLPDTIET